MGREEYCGYCQSPLGLLEIKSNESGIISIRFIDEEFIQKENNNQFIIQTIEELSEYFTNKRIKFTIPTCPEGTPFQKKVWNQLSEIPFGKVKSYKEIALEIGDIKSIRAVGGANGRNPIPIIIPCHRVIGSNGDLTGFSGGIDRKKWLLSHEGALSDNQLSLFEHGI